jgi:NAD(P)-dependent dehydrogenase (short-subunit alcohol dehydrogenase family)
VKSLQELMCLKGCVAVITGGAGHIGSVMAETLAELGAAVVLVDLAAEACDRVSSRIQEKYAVESMPLVVDLSAENEVRLIPDKVLSRFKKLNILVNCAALVGTSELKGWNVPFEEQSSDTWRMALEVNLTSSFVLSQACAGALQATGGGSIINIASIYGLVGPDLRLYGNTRMGNAAAYAASKGGILQLTRWLATVMAPKVRVNSITPGGVWRGQSEDFQERYTLRTPLQRMAREEDFKGAVAYLASNLSSYVTGQNIVVDGGWTAW